MIIEHREAGSGIQSAGNVPAVAGIDAIALYDPRDGHIVHMHSVVVFEGVRRQSADELQLRAVEAARRLGCSVDKLKVLHAPNFSPTAGRVYRVDLKKQTLVEERPAVRARLGK